MALSLVLGFFDGVHKGHRAVINSAFKHSKRVILVTFKISPALFFGHDVKYIFPRNKSIEIIKSLGVSEVVELDFSSIASIPANDYLDNLVNKYHPISISTGFNHTFGLNKTGTPQLLKECSQKYNYIYECVPPVVENGETVSSTKIKNLLSQGNIDIANNLLESIFFIEGVVIHGTKIATTIGFPTANIKYPDNIVQIPFGVYACNVVLNNEKKQYNAIMNWGIKPTLNNYGEPIAEVHLINYNGNLYGQKLTVNILKMIRQERKFKNLDELKYQIQKDIDLCLEL